MSQNETLSDGNTYVVDAENAAEMARLMMLAAQLSEDMGSLFPPQLDLSSTHRVLDIACGPGQWVRDVARAYPRMQVTGGDISHLMIAYASTLITDLPNAHFQLMDAQQALLFPDQSFDFIQARLITAFMLTSAWPRLLAECHRLLRPGGTLCLIEGETCGISNSAALEQMNALVARAMRQAGHCFAPEGNMFGITPVLPRLLKDQGFQQIEQRAFALNFSAGKKANEVMYANHKTGFKLVQPFLLQRDVTTQDELNVIYERALYDMQAPDFCGQLFYLAVAGKKA